MPAKKRSSKKSKSRSTAYRFSVHVKKPRSSKRSLKKSSKKSSKKSMKKMSWVGCVAKARKELGVKGFVAIKKGTPLYKRAKELYDGQRKTV
tara:strand:- start:25 stop:300 length:276 start_codon:yes stop_codon:yes gene_type:complete